MRATRHTGAMKYSLIFAAALMACADSALAQDPMGLPAQATLLDGWQQADGTRIGAIRLTMAPGWKTYWRAPGDAGIPPSFSWNGSRNLAGVTVSWPTPEVFVQNGMRSVGYANEVMLPLAIAANRADQLVDIVLELEIGVCKDICIPQTLRVSGTFDAVGATPQPAIAAALAERPYTAAEAGARDTTCAISPSGDGLSITATLTLPHAGGEEHVVIEAGRPDVWVSEAKVQRRGDTLTAKADIVPNTAGGFALDRSAIRFTVLGSAHAVDLLGCAPG